MPHSVSGNSSPRREGEDDVLPDAPPAETSNDQTQGESEGERAEDAKAGVPLQDLFNDDDDDDDEFPASSAPDNKNGNSSMQQPTM